MNPSISVRNLGNVVTFIPYPYKGGLQEYAIELSRRLRIPIVMVASNNKSLWVEIEYLSRALNSKSFILSADVEVFRNPLVLNPGGYKELKRILREFDIIHSHGPFPLTSDLALSGLNYIFTYHFDIELTSTIANMIARVYKNLMLRKTLKHARIITTTSHAFIEESRLLKRFREKTEVLPLRVKTPKNLNQLMNISIAQDIEQVRGQMSKAYLFAVFELNDYNYLKMPWRVIVEVVPQLSRAMPDSTFYILTDSKSTSKVKSVLEKGDKVRVITISKPVLRYPYKGLMQTVKILKQRLNIEALVVFSGVNLHVWMRIAKSLNIKTLVIMFLTPIYTWRELAVITLRFFPRLFKYGTFLDPVDFIKLCHENALARFILPISRKIGLPDHQSVHVIIMHDNAFNLFKKLGFRAHKATPRLTYMRKEQKLTCSNTNDRIRIAYFGPLVLARGYDIEVELSKKLSKEVPATVTLSSRSKLANNFLKKLSGTNLNVVEKFFRSFEEIVQEAESYDLIILPFRFVLSDIPLVVLELACSGTLVVTTSYSHVTRSSPNLLVLDIDELGNADKIVKLANLARRIHYRYHYIISWEDLVLLMKRILGGEE